MLFQIEGRWPNRCDFSRLGNVTHLGRSVTVAQQVRVVVAFARVHETGLYAHPAARERPSRRLDENETHPTRRVRPAVRTRPRPEDLPRLGARRRHRQTADGPTRRPPSSQELTKAMMRCLHRSRAPSRRRRSGPPATRACGRVSHRFDRGASGRAKLPGRPAIRLSSAGRLLQAVGPTSGRSPTRSR